MTNATLSLVRDGFIFPEGLRWRDGQLWLSDMWDHAVYRLDASGELERICTVPQRPSGLGFLPDGTLLISSMADRSLYRLEKSGLVLHGDLSALATGDLNDLLVDGQGGAYVGNFGYDLFGGAAPVRAKLSLVTPDGAVREVADDLDFPNGMVLLDEGRVLVVAETWSNKLTAFDRSADGSLSNRRVYAALGERTPDGICADAEDGIWVSSFTTGEFIRLSREGELTDRHECGGRAVACVLGGSDGRTLFCATFNGGIEDIHALKRAGMVSTTRVSIPAQPFAW